MPADLYVVSSQGRTATTWLSIALNLHPDIACAHGRAFPLVFHDLSQLTDGSLVLGEEGNDSWGSGAARLNEASLADIIRNGKLQRPDAKCLTIVHVINAYELRHRYVNEGFSGTIRNINVVRHPISRTESYASEFRRGWDPWGAGSFAQAMLHYRETNPTIRRWAVVCEELGVDLDEVDNFLWLAGLCWIVEDFNDLEMDVLHVPFERLTGDIDYFCWFFRRLYGVDIPLSTSFLEQVQALPIVHQATSRRSVVDIYCGWDGWKQAIFKLFMVENRLRQRYRPFDYELDFVLDGDTRFV